MNKAVFRLSSLRNLTIAACFCCCVDIVNAVTACPDVATVVQPDGSKIELRLNGDEFLNWTSTADGYTVVRNAEGFYVYAVDNDGVLSPGEIIAHSPSLRSSAEKEYLSGIRKNIMPAMSQETKLQKAAANDNVAKIGSGKYDYTKFRGLVLLIEYNDREFIREDAHSLFDEMINAHDYSGFMTDAIIPEKIEYTGSVRDYFYENSMGMFDPHFDVVGPIKIDHSQYDIQRTSLAQTIVRAACNAADEQVDFSQYDTDGDGKVDMFFIIFAGGGSNYSGNDSRLVWPHASTVASSTRLDGVSLGRYACSTELYGRPETGMIDGIGTICHEFSHVLGLADEYDTDGTSSGGDSVDPGKWSLMAQGSYLNYSRTPCGYSLFERYQSGFATPVKIEGEGSFTLQPLAESNSGYRINSAIDNEYFLLENRRKTGWDEYLPGEGMLVFRVDSTDVSVWENNKINVNPAHNYYELLRATPEVSGSTVRDSEGDPYPGSGNVTELTNDTEPNIRSWTQIPSNLILNGITDDGTNISFSVKSDALPYDVEDFESMTVTDGNASGVKGKFCSWDFEDAVVTTPEEGLCNGTQAVAINRKGTVTARGINGNVQQWEFKVFHPDASSATPTIFRCQYSLDDGTTWKTAKNVNGVENVTVESGKTTTVRFNLGLEQPACFRITEFTGSSSFPCYIDNVLFRFDRNYAAVGNIDADRDAEFYVTRTPDGFMVKNLAGNSKISVCNAGGSVVAVAEASDDGIAVISGLQKGFYIVTDGNRSHKIIF